MVGWSQGEVDALTKGSVWMNTAYPISIENIDDKIVVFMIWNEHDVFALENMHLIESACKNKFNVQLISAIIGDANNPRPRREIFSLIQRQNLEHPIVICPDFNGLKGSPYDGHFQARIYPASRGVASHIFEGQLAGKQCAEQLQLLMNDADVNKNLRFWQIKDSVETHWWADANIEFPTDISQKKNKSFFITESNHHRIHQITPTGELIQIIGMPLPGFEDGPLAGARFCYPQGTIYDETQQLLYVADTYNHRIRACDETSNLVFTIAGNGKRFEMEKTFTDGGYEAFGFPVDVAFDNEILYVLSAEFNQVFKLNPISGAAREVARLPMTSSSGIRIFPKHFEIYGKLGYVTFSNGSIFELKFDEEKKEKDVISQKEVSYLYAHGQWYYEPKEGEPKLSSISLIGKKLFACSEWNNELYEFKKKQLKKLTGSPIDGWKDGPADEAMFHSPVDMTVIDRNLYVLDRDNELLRSINSKRKKTQTIPFKSSDALLFGGNVVPQGENFVIEDVVVGEGLVEITFQIDPSEYVLREDGINFVMLIDEVMGELESEVVSDGKIKVKVDPSKLVYGTLQIELTFSCSSPLRPAVVLRKQAMVTAMITVIPGEPKEATVIFKPHILPY
jgi:NHL repeat